MNLKGKLAFIAFLKTYEALFELAVNPVTENILSYVEFSVLILPAVSFYIFKTAGFKRLTHLFTPNKSLSQLLLFTT